MTNFAKERLLLLLSPRQKRELAFDAHITEVAPSGRIFRIHKRKNAQLELRTGASRFSRRRVLLCVLPESFSSQRHETFTTNRWGSRSYKFWTTEMQWTITRYDVMAGLLAAIRAGDEERLIGTAVWVTDAPWGIGLSEGERAIRNRGWHHWEENYR